MFTQSSASTVHRAPSPVAWPEHKLLTAASLRGASLELKTIHEFGDLGHEFTMNWALRIAILISLLLHVADQVCHIFINAFSEFL